MWENGAEEVKHTFMRWALPITWDFAEANPIAPIERFYQGGINSAFRVLSNLDASNLDRVPPPHILNASATSIESNEVDVVFTDPPYYDAIPYSDLMDFFYVWLKRSIRGFSPVFDAAFSRKIAPKWDNATQMES